jgi:DNA repair photolyase
MAWLVANPPNPWLSAHVEWLEEPPAVQLQVFEEQARSLLTGNDSPDIPFRWSVNPYRGCYHGCAYCYARPSHQYLDWGAGTDFERRLVVKINAPDLLHRELARRSWQGEPIHFSGNTDCYQPLEASYALTRRCLEVCLAHRNPVTVVTKGRLICRDVDLLAELAREAGATVHVSVPFADPAISHALEPYAPAPAQRLATMAHLASAGIPTGVMVAPIIPGLNDREIPAILTAARDAGATTAAMTLLRLPAEVLPVFRTRLAATLPEKAGKIWSGLRDMRDGRLTDPRFGSRMRGTGARWQAVTDLFNLHCHRLGLSAPSAPAARGPAQADLFTLLEPARSQDAQRPDGTPLGRARHRS